MAATSGLAKKLTDIAVESSPGTVAFTLTGGEVKGTVIGAVRKAAVDGKILTLDQGNLF